LKLREFLLLTDENLDPDVVTHLRMLGFDVVDVVERGLQGAADVDSQAILAKAFRGELVPTETELARREGRAYEPASVLRGKPAAAELDPGLDSPRGGWTSLDVASGVEYLRAA
jgi:type I restriction enzyme S subunit